MDGTGFYENSSSDILFYPSVDESPISLGPIDREVEIPVYFLSHNTTVNHSKDSKHLWNEPSRKMMIDDYDYHQFNDPLEDIFGHIPNAATIFKTIKLEGTEVQTKVAYVIDIDSAIIQSDIVDTLSGKRYEVDKTLEQKDAINKVYEMVMEDLKQNSNNNHILVPKNNQQG